MATAVVLRVLRVHYCLRLLPPALTAVFAAAHDHNILQLLHVVPCDTDPLPQSAAARVNQFLRHGGLGLRGAAEHEPAAYFASASSLSCLMTLHLPPHSPAV